VKILHTADWHAGRTLHGLDRTPEVREVLRELAALAVEEEVDLILVAGDLYDGKRPSSEAEAAVYEFFLTTGQKGIPSVVIAGNHDSPSRLDAVGGLLKLANVHVVGEPKVAGQGGTFTLGLNGEVARIAALPFISERRLVRAAELLGGDPGHWRQRYAEGMRKLVANVTQPFDEESVNLLLMHTTMEGATLANSEYQFHCSEAYTLSPDIFPSACSYVALGHIHKPQPIQGYPAYGGRYAGSVLQLDFGEQGDKKFAYMITAKPGEPCEVSEYEIASGKRLKQLRLDVDELERRHGDLRDFPGWLKLKLTLERPLPGLKDRIKANLPNVLAVEVELPGEAQETESGVDHEALGLVEAYAQYYESRSLELPDALRQAFGELYEDIFGEGSSA
jgi:DNA repair protein SbcD/Mre11